MICEILCRPNVSFKLVNEILSILAYLSAIDDDNIDQWLNENILKQLHRICSMYIIF